MTPGPTLDSSPLYELLLAPVVSEIVLPARAGLMLLDSALTLPRTICHSLLLSLRSCGAPLRLKG